jgi:hypothetical protein
VQANRTAPRPNAGAFCIRDNSCLLQAKQTALKPEFANADGMPVTLEGEDFYKIANYDRLRPFLMTVVSSSDLWMFISSAGALTAGRGDPDGALFPYYTEDKIHDSAENTGSKTIVIVEREGADRVWEPFSIRSEGRYRICRNLYKNFCGNKLIFEEVNQDLGVSFRYGWFSSDAFGFVRKAWLHRAGSAGSAQDGAPPAWPARRSTVARGGVGRLKVLDGIQNLLPCGVGSQLQLEKSILVDAYKKNELLPEAGLGLYTLSSIPIDRPEPAEALRATAVWSIGLEGSIKLLSSLQLDDFRQGRRLRQEVDIRAERGAYFLGAEISLRQGQTQSWLLAADTGLGAPQIVQLREMLREPARLRQRVEEDIDAGATELRRIAAMSDGLQKTASALRDARHFSNALFNGMRGGVFYNGCQVESADLRIFARQSNRQLAQEHSKWFDALDEKVEHGRLLGLARQTGDASLERICQEYLPLTFSRRHGDPSRPWNRFCLAPLNRDGRRPLQYEGNWRDIFQNWEALALAFPGYAASMICKFANASTADGYNPYRVSREGFDWEIIDPDDPWSHIGYWGDHQLIYLLKLLEILQSHDSAALREFLRREIFAYANVPYRIAPYAQMLDNPKETVRFDASLDRQVRERSEAFGQAGALLWDKKDRVVLVNLTEKLLVSLLAKLFNFIPEAGIWLNTQRPEWNDANNALVGTGASVVTLHHLRRFLAFCAEVFGSTMDEEITLSQEVAQTAVIVTRILRRHARRLAQRLDDFGRKKVLDDLGRAGADYRSGIYARGFSGQKTRVKPKQLLEFFQIALRWTDHSIRSNRRPGGLYHAYNLVCVSDRRKITIRRLYEMLEGQVAALSSGNLSARQSVVLLRALRSSSMYRADQHSYLLYPDRSLPRFTDKNNLTAGQIVRSPLLRKLAAEGNRLLVERDAAGGHHFHGAITNAGDVARVLDELSKLGYADLVKQEGRRVLATFERLFDHQSFTGRSGAFFGYEGLGCIYWHMVSKLLLAVQETFFRAREAGAPKLLVQEIVQCYYDIRSGLGDHKSPAQYGAFPMDPYSHTPAHAGARQPGLTGQVKEDLLCRAGELGVAVKGGRIHFRPHLLRREEFLTAPSQWKYFDVGGAEQRLLLEAGSLAFTCCQTPVIYRLADANRLVVRGTDGWVSEQAELILDAAASQSIFAREGKIDRIVIALALSALPASQALRRKVAPQ